MQVFVTGASGFIGGAVASALIAAGHKVRGLVRNSAKAAAVAGHGIEVVIGSLDDAVPDHGASSGGGGRIGAGEKNGKPRNPGRNPGTNACGVRALLGKAPLRRHPTPPPVVHWVWRRSRKERLCRLSFRRWCCPEDVKSWAQL